MGVVMGTDSTESESGSVFEGIQYADVTYTYVNTNRKHSRFDRFIMLKD